MATWVNKTTAISRWPNVGARTSVSTLLFSVLPRDCNLVIADPIAHLVFFFTAVSAKSARTMLGPHQGPHRVVVVALAACFAGSAALRPPISAFSVTPALGESCRARAQARV